MRFTKILVVEDNTSFRALLKSVINKIGRFDVDYTADGTTGLAKLTTNTYDVVFLDYMLPDINGTELLHKIDSKLTYVFLVTAYADLKLVAEIKKFPNKINSVFTKPLELESFSAKLSQVFLTANLKHRQRDEQSNSEHVSQTVQPPLTLTISAVDQGNKFILEFYGDLTNDNKKLVTRTISRVDVIRSPTIVLDLSHVTTLDSAGIGLLLMINGLFAEHSKTVYLACESNSTISDRLASLHLYSIIPPYLATLHNF